MIRGNGLKIFFFVIAVTDRKVTKIFNVESQNYFASLLRYAMAW
jgi:hypothetical protein